MAFHVSTDTPKYPMLVFLMTWQKKRLTTKILQIQNLVNPLEEDKNLETISK